MKKYLIGLSFLILTFCNSDDATKPQGTVSNKTVVVAPQNDPILGQAEATGRLGGRYTGGSVSRFDFTVSGSGGVSLLEYNGQAQLRGHIVFSNVYSSTYSHHSHTSCPAVNRPYPFTCNARFFKSIRKFICESVLIGTQSYRIEGWIGPSKTTSHNYDVVSLEIEGPCFPPRGYY